ncbi:hypothetical protein CQW23_33816 [Capsicum baccatum]|uniref:Uncharacterized protein n=1 Tax=Capsicum baccatum TaxID=33114 RepID=A0A2G2V0R9_CAPBA|nr:hypothetical protein CQW23_33816 [Capsicum baccatum]
MAGGIEEPFRLSFQVKLLLDLTLCYCHFQMHFYDSWQSGSISFGRFENEALCWERRSSFTHNKYLEEVEKYYKTGSVTKKKAYFEKLFRRRALLSQSSSDCQDGADFKQVMMDLRIQIIRGTLSMLMRFAILHALLKILIEQPLQIST